MSFDFSLSTKVIPLEIFTLKKKNALKISYYDLLSKLNSSLRNEKTNEYMYFLYRDQNSGTKWFINRQDFHLMQLIAKLEINIKETNEELIMSKSALNKVNLNNVSALKMNQIFWIKKGSQSQNLIENYLEEKIKKDRDLEKKLSNLIQNNIKTLTILKDLVQSRIQPNFANTIVKIKIEQTLAT